MPQLSVLESRPLTPEEETPAPDIRALVDQKADQYGVPRDLARTVARIESNFKPSALSPKGAIGTMQLMPATAKSLGVSDINDPVQNIDGGMRLLSQLQRKYNGDRRLVLAAYNAGEPAVDQAGGVPNYPETQQYVAMGTDAAGGTSQKDVLSRMLAGENIPLTPEVIRQIMAGPQPATDSGTPTPAPAQAPVAAPKSAPLTILESRPLESTPLSSVADPLKDEGFLQSAWNAFIGPFAVTLHPGGYFRTTQEQIRQANELKKSGTPEQKRQWARDVLLQNMPTASTIYKLATGNYGGAAGDIAGMVALGGAAKVAGSALDVVTRPRPGAPGAGGPPPPTRPPGGPPGGPTGPRTPPGGFFEALDKLDNPAVRAGLKLHPKTRMLLYLYDLWKGVQRTQEPTPSRPPPAPAKPAPNVPVTAPTSEALLNLYSIETNPAKLETIRAELLKRGILRESGAVPPAVNPYRTYSQEALRKTYELETNPQKRAIIEQAARDRNLSLLTREGRRATATVPETGFTERTGPSVTQDDALMLRYLGIEDPLRADAETIATARQLAGENPTLLSRLRAGTVEEPAAATPAARAPEPQPAPATPPATPPPAPTGTPGQQYAASIGANWKSLSAEHRAFMEQAAQAQQNFAQQQLELVTRPGPQERAFISQPAAETVGTASEVPTLEYNAPTTEPPPAPASREVLQQQLESALRPDLIHDYLVRNKIPTSMVDQFGDKEWRMVTEGAGLTNPPTPEEIPGIRARLAEYEGAGNLPPDLGNMTPAEATQQIEKQRQVRTRGKKKAAPVEEASVQNQPAQAPQEIARSLKDLMEESGTAAPSQPAKEGPPAPTQSQKRVEALAQHLAGIKDLSTEAIASLPDNPNALRQLERLSEGIDIEGRPTADEIPQIVDRVKQIRGGTAPPVEPVQETPVQEPVAPQEPVPAKAEEPAAPTAAKPGRTKSAGGTGKPPTTISGGLADTLQGMADAAMERMRKRGSFSGTKLHAVFPAEDLGDMAIWGAAKIAKGTVQFAKWSKEMLADAGAAADVLRPHLAEIYQKSQKKYADHVERTAGKLASTKQLLRMYKEGEPGKDWYKYTQAELEQHFGEDAPLFVDMLAATSPNNTVEGNVTMALKAYVQHKTGKPFTGYMPAVIGNLERVAQGISPSGPKVSSFKANLFGNTEAVTVDRWMARAMGMPSDNLTPAQYKFLDYQLTQIAKKAGVEPRQMQAAIWRAIKEAQGRAGNTSESFEQVLARHVQTKPELARVLQELSAARATRRPQVPLQ